MTVFVYVDFLLNTVQASQYLAQGFAQRIGQLVMMKIRFVARRFLTPHDNLPGDADYHRIGRHRLDYHRIGAHPAAAADFDGAEGEWRPVIELPVGV